MKTPWKFLVELTSRRRPAKGQENVIGHATDPEPRDDKTEQAQKPRSTESSTSADRDEAVPVDDVPAGSNEKEASPEARQALARPADSQEARAAAEAAHSDARANVPAPIRGTSAKSQRKAPIKHRDRAKRIPADVVAQSAVTAQESQRVQPSFSRDAFFNDVASLDDDIKTLKSELAQKLQRQNAQLKKMLKRFDVS